MICIVGAHMNSFNVQFAHVVSQKNRYSVSYILISEEMKLCKHTMLMLRQMNTLDV